MMRKIQKQISLEPMTSRLPSVWPSYMGDKLYFFDEVSLEERKWQYLSNYGMIPMNIIVTPIPSKDLKSSAYSLSSRCHCYEGGGDHDYDELCDFVLSYENFGKWYHFFVEYYNLLKEYGHCSRVYTSAEDYYNYESLSKYADQMVYGGGREAYVDLDKRFGEMGGNVMVTVFNKVTSKYAEVTPQKAHDEAEDDSTAIVDVYDVGFFKWLCENVMPSFIIPSDYSDYWKKDVLFYPDVIEWLSWFNARNDKYRDLYIEGENGEVPHWNCKDESVDECCECEEYFNRGGEKMFNALKAWLNAVQRNIKDNKVYISNNKACFIPTVIHPIQIETSIDDLGEKSIFSKEYELGIDYRTVKTTTSDDGKVTIDYNGGNTNSGTTASVDGESVILSSGVGFNFDDVFMEKWFNKCEKCSYEGVFGSVCPKCGRKHSRDWYGLQDGSLWESYTRKYIDDNIDDFAVNGITFYAFDEDNVKYTTDETRREDAMVDLRSQMNKRYELTLSEHGWVLIGDSLYEIEEREYGVYDSSNQYLSGKTYTVEREEFTKTPYTYVNGKKIYAEFYDKEGLFYFPFFKKKESKSTCSGTTFNINDYYTYKRNQPTEKKLCVNYLDTAFIIDSTATTVNVGDGLVCSRISGYTLDSNGEYLYYTYDREIVDKDLNKVANATLDGNYVVIQNIGDFLMYSVDEITGRTVSKLYDLRLLNILYDDIGNEIDGIYDVLKKDNHQPSEGEELDLIYQVGNVANVNRFSITAKDSKDITSEQNFFVGDIITKMSFYFNESNLGKIDDLVVDVVLENDSDVYVYNKGKELKKYDKPSECSSLYAITEARKLMEKYREENILAVFDEDVHCDITYYVGATLMRTIGKRFNLSNVYDRNNHGVRYDESVRFARENREYYLKRPKKIDKVLPREKNVVGNHSVSYPVVVYTLTQNLERVTESQYDTSYDVPMATFKTNIDIYEPYGGSSTYQGELDMAKRNNMEVYPTFREEYLLGSSSLENVDADIYIDRGINAAYEKHIKLGEVRSLESLEQYGLNFFKILTS